MTEFTIALIGEGMIELQEIRPGEIHQTFGGDTLNTAIYMARIAGRLPTRIEYVTALGDDSFSESMIAFWEKEGVGSSLVQRLENKRPGLYYIQLDESGERFFHYWRGESAARGCFEYPQSHEILTGLADFDAIYLSGISLAILLPDSRRNLLDTLARLNSKGTHIYFDCNYRPHLWESNKQARTIYRDLFSLAHTVLLNGEEGGILLDCHSAEDTHRTLQSAGVQESVIRNGPDPCSVFHDNSIFSIPACRVETVVDTTAAGDSFSAAYLLARRNAVSAIDAARYAHTVAAYVISHKGAIAPPDGMPPLPVRKKEGDSP